MYRSCEFVYRAYRDISNNARKRKEFLLLYIYFTSNKFIFFSPSFSWKLKFPVMFYRNELFRYIRFANYFHFLNTCCFLINLVFFLHHFYLFTKKFTILEIYVIHNRPAHTNDPPLKIIPFFPRNCWIVNRSKKEKSIRIL